MLVSRIFDEFWLKPALDLTKLFSRNIDYCYAAILVVTEDSDHVFHNVGIEQFSQGKKVCAKATFVGLYDVDVFHTFVTSLLLSVLCYVLLYMMTLDWSKGYS